MALETWHVQCNQSPSESRPGQARSCAHHGAQLRGADVGVRSELQDRGALGMRAREIAHAAPILDAKHTHTHTHTQRERDTESVRRTHGGLQTHLRKRGPSLSGARSPRAPVACAPLRHGLGWPRS